MEMKTCPSCGAEVPAAASTCKTCFHDFKAVAPRKSSSPILILVAIAGVAIVAAFMLWTKTNVELGSRVLFDEGSHSVQLIREFSSGQTETHAIPYDEIASLEFVENLPNGSIWIVTTTGKRIELAHGDPRDLKLKASDYAAAVGKPLTTKDESSVSVPQ